MATRLHKLGGETEPRDAGLYPWAMTRAEETRPVEARGAGEKVEEWIL